MSEILEKGVGRTTTNVSVVTTAETIAVTSEKVIPPRPGVRALIKATIQLDSGAATTTVTPRIRRGTVVTGTLVSEAIPEETTAAQAATWVVTAFEVLGDLGEVQYVATVEQASATGNGTINNATIEVELLG